MKLGMAERTAYPRPISSGSMESARRADVAGNWKTMRPLMKLAAARNLQSGARV